MILLSISTPVLRPGHISAFPSPSLTPLLSLCGTPDMTHHAVGIVKYLPSPGPPEAGWDVESGDPSLLGVWLLRQSSSVLSAYRRSGSFWLCSVCSTELTSCSFCAWLFWVLTPLPSLHQEVCHLGTHFIQLLGIINPVWPAIPEEAFYFDFKSLGALKKLTYSFLLLYSLFREDSGWNCRGWFINWEMRSLEFSKSPNNKSFRQMFGVLENLDAESVTVWHMVLSLLCILLSFTVKPVLFFVLIYFFASFHS